MSNFDGTKIIMGAVSIILGLVMLPVMGAFIWDAKYYQNASGGWNDDTNITGTAGLTSLLNLVMYGFTFGLVGLGIGLIYIGIKGKIK